MKVSGPRHLLAAAVAVVATAVLLVASATLYMTWQGSPEQLRARTGSLVSVESHALRHLRASRLDELTLRSSTGLTVHALARVPEGSGGPYAGAIVVGGMKRGSRIVTAAGLDAIAREAVVVSPDYPIQLRRDSWKGLQALETFARLRPAAFDMVSDVMLLVDYLATRPDVDQRRLMLIGGSLGAVAVTVAGGVDPRPAAVVVLYGGGRVGSLIAHTLEHPAQGIRVPRWAAPGVGRVLGWWLTPLAPERYAPSIAPRAFIMINGGGDSLVPRRYARALYQAARAPKEMVWVPGEHIEPSEASLLEHVAGVVTARLVAHGVLLH